MDPFSGVLDLVTCAAVCGPIDAHNNFTEVAVLMNGYRLRCLGTLSFLAPFTFSLWLSSRALGLWRVDHLSRRSMGLAVSGKSHVHDYALATGSMRKTVVIPVDLGCLGG